MLKGETRELNGKYMANYVLGDVHGRYKALQQVFERANFNKDEDLLISIGDIVDRGEEPFECIKFLNEIPNSKLIMGNHDYNFYNYAISGHDGFQGHSGVNVTVSQWAKLVKEEKKMAIDFFETQLPYYIFKNKCFVHGGFDRDHPMEKQSLLTYIWDRDLWTEAMSTSKGQKLKTADNFDAIYLGHTPTIIWNELDKNIGMQLPITHPMHKGGVWNVDTGAGFPEGKLTLMNIDTDEYFQSDLIKTLYEL